MNRLPRLAVPLGASSCALLVLAACGDPLQPTPCPAALEPGELVITELMTNPAGANAGKQWIELNNNSDRDIELDGVTLAFARERGSGGKSHRVASSEIKLPAGAYVTLGGVRDEARPAHIDYGFGDALGAMTSSHGIFQVQCGATLVDEVEYGLPVEAALGETSDEDEYLDFEAASFSLDGALPPDHKRNDDPANWCVAAVAYAPGDGETTEYGTPGQPNPECLPDVINAATKCVVVDGDAVGTLRDINHPGPGDIIINELMSAPSDALDKPDKGEWFELYVTRDIDLNGLRIGAVSKLDETLIDDDSLPLEQRVRLKGDDADIKIDEDGDCAPVTAGSYLLFARGDDPSVNGELPAPDFVFSFDLLTTGGSGVFVGLQNHFGGITPLDVFIHDDAPKGASRSLAPDVLTEDDPVLANNDPARWCAATEPYGLGGAGTPGAANEVCLGGPGNPCDDDGLIRDAIPPEAGDLIINELMPDPNNPETVESDEHGEWLELLVTRDVDLTGLELGRAGEIEMTLGADDPSCLAAHAGDYLVLARYDDPEVNGGVEPVFATFDVSLNNSNADLFIGYRGEVLDHVEWSSTTTGAALQLSIDDPPAWCDATEPYGLGDLGTPGAANTICLDDGDPPDPPDPEPQCDDGGQARDPVLPGPGDIIIAEFMADPSATDSDAEWVELRVEGAFDLYGVQIYDKEDGFADNAKTLAPPDGPANACMPVQPGQHLVLAKSFDQNGGLPQVDLELPIGLTNSGESIVVGHADVILDVVNFGPQSKGVARSLDPGSDDNLDADAPPWCDATTEISAELLDLGTPGQENPPCG